MAKYDLEYKINMYLQYQDYHEVGDEIPSDFDFDYIFDDELLKHLIQIKHVEKGITSFRMYPEHVARILSGPKAPLLIDLLFEVSTFNLDKGSLVEVILENPAILKYFKHRIAKSDQIHTGILNLMSNYPQLSIACAEDIKQNDYIADFLLRNSIDFTKAVIFDEDYFNLLSKQSAETIISIVSKLDYNDKFRDLIDRKLANVNGANLINIISRYYNPQLNSPQYLEAYYEFYKEDIEKSKLKNKVKDNMSLEDKALLSSETGIEFLMETYLEPRYSHILDVIGLDGMYRELRKEHLFGILSNYEQYSLNVIKNVFAAYYFEKSCNDIKIDLKTILEYASKSSDARSIIGDKMGELATIYYYLNSDNILANPCEIVKSDNIAEIVSSALDEMHQLFQADLQNKATINTDKLVERDGIYYLEDDNPYFVIHTTGIPESGQEMVTRYKNNAEKHGKMCFSFFGDGKYGTFLKDCIIFGYDDLEGFSLYSACPRDAQTNQRRSMNRQYGSVLLPIDDFLHYTNPNSYNEIAFFTQFKVKCPNYILSLNKEPTDIEKEIAEAFDIPIIVYYTKTINNDFENRKLEEYNYSDELVVLKKFDRKELEHVPA